MIEKEMLSEQHREPPLFGLPATTWTRHFKVGRLLKHSMLMPLHEKCQIRIVRHTTKPSPKPVSKGWSSTAWILRSLPMHRLESLAQFLVNLLPAVARETHFAGLRP